MMIQRAMEFIFRDNKGRECREDLEVFNSYPLYLKIRSDINKGIYLFNELRTYDIQKKQSISKFINKIYMPLLDFTTSIYLDFKKGKTDFEDFGGLEYKIEEIIYGNFKLLFIRTYRQLIFANYVDRYDNINYQNIRNYIIPNIPSLDTYSRDIKFNNNTYKTINTCNSFLSFGGIKKQNINDRLNSLFFGTFQFALSKEDEGYLSQNIFRLLSDGERKVSEVNIISNQQTGYLFKYIMINDIMIITKYIFKAEDLDDLI